MSTYSLNLRSELNRRLTIGEMDGNFLYLEKLAQEIATGVTGPTGPGGGGSSYNQDLNTFDDVLFDSVSTEYIIGQEGAVLLIPDNNVPWQAAVFYATNNVIDENHIHIAPAAPWTDLFLGPDESYVAIKSTGDIEANPLSGTVSVKGNLNLFKNEVGNITILNSDTYAFVQGMAIDDSGYTYAVGGNDGTNIVSKIKDGEFIWSEEILVPGLSPSTTISLNSIIWSDNNLYVTAQWSTCFTVFEMNDTNGQILNSWTYEDENGFDLTDIAVYGNNPVVVGTKSNEYIVATISSVTIGSTVSSLVVNSNQFNDIVKVPLYNETWQINGDGFTDWTQINTNLTNIIQNLPVISLTGEGQNLTVDLWYTPGGDYINIEKNTLGSSYSVGDQLLIKGSLLYGIDSVTYSAQIFTTSGDSLYFDNSVYTDFDQIVQNGWLVTGTGINGYGVVSNLQNTGGLWRVDIGQNVTINLNTGDTVEFSNNGNDCKFRVDYVDVSNIYFNNITGINVNNNIIINVSQPVDFSQPGNWQLRTSTINQAFIWTKNWSKSIGNTGNEYGKSVAVDNNNNIFFSMNYYTDSNENLSGLVVKFDSTGNLIWSKYYDDSVQYNEIFSICTNSVNDLFLLAFNDDGNLIITKSTNDGEIFWQRRLNDNDWDNYPQIGIDGDGNIIISGSYYNNNTNSSDFIFIKFDTDGNLIRSSILGDPSLSEYDFWDFDSKVLTVKGQYLYKAGFRINSNQTPEGLLITLNTSLEGLGEYSNWSYSNIDLVFETPSIVEPTNTTIYITDSVLNSIEPEYMTNESTGFTLQEVIIAKNSNIKNVESIIFSDGSSISSSLIPQNLQTSNNNYTLQLSDAGKHIYRKDGNGYGINIPINNDVPFKIGTAITLISGDSPLYFNIENSGVTEVWGAGYNQTSNYWYIPTRSMATLIKIERDVWMLSGAGLNID